MAISTKVARKAGRILRGVGRKPRTHLMANKRAPRRRLPGSRTGSRFVVVPGVCSLRIAVVAVCAIGMDTTCPSFQKDPLRLYVRVCSCVGHGRGRSHPLPSNVCVRVCVATSLRICPYFHHSRARPLGSNVLITHDSALRQLQNWRRRNPAVVEARSAFQLRLQAPTRRDAHLQ